MVIGSIQIGKNGITDNFIASLQNQFKKKNSIRISVLKNARGDGKAGKEKVKEYAGILLKKMGSKYTTKTIGFVIVLKKWRREQREE